MPNPRNSSPLEEILRNMIDESEAHGHELLPEGEEDIPTRFKAKIESWVMEETASLRTELAECQKRLAMSDRQLVELSNKLKRKQ